MRQAMLATRAQALSQCPIRACTPMQIATTTLIMYAMVGR